MEFTTNVDLGNAQIVIVASRGAGGEWDVHAKFNQMADGMLTLEMVRELAVLMEKAAKYAEVIADLDKAEAVQS